MDSLLALASYAFVTSITPGPNNIMLTASGISFGFKKTVPHMLGIPFGFGIQLALCSIGLGSILLNVPAAYVGLKIFGTSYLLYLAWSLRGNAIIKEDPEIANTKPMSFTNAALFQFANPKAWVMAITGAAIFMPHYESFLLSITILCVVFCLINLPCVGVWAILGSSIKHILNKPTWQRTFSTILLLLILYSAIAVWL